MLFCLTGVTSGAGGVEGADGVVENDSSSGTGAGAGTDVSVGAGLYLDIMSSTVPLISSAF